MVAIKSMITKKGQTTIPAKIRKALNLEPGDALRYELGKGEVIVKPIRGSILDVAGSVRPRRRPEDFKKIREKTKATVARHIVKEMK